jgi:hypothetical protein
MSRDVGNLSDCDHGDEFFGEDCFATVTIYDDACSANTYDLLTAQDDIAMKERHRTFGYHESYEHYEKFKLQDGFVAGYQDTFNAACRIGELLGQLELAFKSMILLQGCDDDDSCYSHRRTAEKIREVLELITNTEGPDNTASSFVREKLEELEKEITI